MSLLLFRMSLVTTIYIWLVANTGYAGYFQNTGTGAINYGIYATTASSTGWAGYFNGNVYVNGTITMSSDRRMKKDIETLDTEDALDEITALRPVAFTWKKTALLTWASSRRRSIWFTQTS
jgi:Chaperone of endosialidase